MSKQTINIGASPNDGTGTPLRTSFDYTNQNFTELYNALGGGVGLPGATTQVIFNDGGTNLAGDAGLVYNKTTDTLTAGNATITGALTVDTTTLVVNPSGYADCVGIGTATPGAALEVSGSATNIFIRSTDTNDSALRYYVNGTEVAVCRGKNGNSYAIETAGAESLRINSTGNIVLKGGTAAANGVGVTFPATQVASSDANCLDDYEEGDWTIGLTFGGASTGMTTNANTGRYTKIGRQVTVTGYLALSNKGSATGDALITGLPFLINSYGGLSIYLAQITFADFPMGYSNNGTSTIPLRECTNAGVASSLTDADFANNSEIIFTMTYTA